MPVSWVAPSNSFEGVVTIAVGHTVVVSRAIEDCPTNLSEKWRSEDLLYKTTSVPVGSPDPTERLARSGDLASTEAGYLL